MKLKDHKRKKPDGICFQGQVEIEALPAEVRWHFLSGCLRGVEWYDLVGGAAE